MSEEFSAAEIGALAHLYRGEVYRSTVWRTRLDTTTNWAVVTLGVALSITYSSPDASPLPLVLVGVLILLFLTLEARRYRFFNVWRARARWIERHFYVPMLMDGDLHTENDWQTTLAEDYRNPQYHVSYMIAVARRVRSNYLWILLIQTVAYMGKLMVHPVAVSSLCEISSNAPTSARFRASWFCWPAASTSPPASGLCSGSTASTGSAAATAAARHVDGLTDRQIGHSPPPRPWT